MMNAELCRKIGYQFKDSKLLTLALTHRSKSHLNNERLEFLGDSLVNCVIAEALYQQFPHAQEGDLSRWRATLINRDTLAKLARDFHLGRHLLLGPGELKSGGSERHSILSCAMEALIGAIYLDSGFLAVRECLLAWYEPFLKEISPKTNNKDPKTILQEYLQHKHLALPIYEVKAIEGEAHEQYFVVTCQVPGIADTVIGRGSSRRRAEQDAATIMLGIIKK